MSGTGLENIVPQDIMLKEGSNTNMNVDGSSVTKIYKFKPATGEIFLLENLTIFLLDPGTMSHSNFGSISSLSTGLRLTIKSYGNEKDTKNLKDNVDMFFVFRNQKESGVTTTGFLDDEDYFSGIKMFAVGTINGLELRGDDGDLIKLAVRDDLTGITRLEAQVTVRQLE